MTRFLLFCAVLIVVILPHLATCHALVYLDNLPFIGAALDYHTRTGILEFDDHHRQETAMRSFATAGVTIGKRWSIARNLRLQIKANLHYGSTPEDTLENVPTDEGDTIATIINLSMFHCGIIGEFQAPYSIAPNGSLFLVFGGGIHGVYSKEFETLEGSPRTRIIDPYLEEHRMAGASIHGGIGFEFRISPLLGFSTSYGARYWRPLQYGMYRDLFPYRPVDYHENFISHEFSVILLVKRR